MTQCTGAGGTGTKYTYAQLEGLWIKAGGPKTVAPLAAAISMAESGGCTAALNLTDNGGAQTSVGLWQVSNGTHSYPAAWNSAAGNATEAVAKYRQNNDFSPWGTYSSGAYRAFLNGSTTPDTNVPGSSTEPSSTGGTGKGSGCLISLPSVPLVGTGCLFGKSQARALIGGLMLIGGGGIMIVGVVVLVATAFSGSKTGQAAVKVAGVVPGVGTGVKAATRVAARA